MIGVAGFLVAMFAPAYVIALFNPKSQRDPQLMEVGTHAIRICLAMYPIVGFQIVSSSYFQAVGKPKHALLLGLSRQVLLLIPAILILPHFLGLNGVWLAIPTADLCCLAADRCLAVPRAAALAGSARGRRRRAGSDVRSSGSGVDQRRGTIQHESWRWKPMCG